MNKYIYIISVLIIFTILSIISSVADKKKIDYIRISKESGGPALDTLDETLPILATASGKLMDVFHRT